MRFLLLLAASPLLLASEDAAAIMAKVAANVESATEARRQFVYEQTVRGNLSKGGKRLCRETRQYSVYPSPSGTEKRIESFNVDCGKAKDGNEQDGLLNELTEELINAKGSRDGIPKNLFPLRSGELAKYAFTFKGEAEAQGRPVYKIGFDPTKRNLCVHVGSDEESDCDTPWAGEAWIDKADLQPVRIDTHLARGVPWAIRAFLGTNVKQLGFSVTYKRVGGGVWFPETYGTEFQIEALFFYKRTIALNLESSGFKKADASSTIQYDLEADPKK